MNSLSSARRAAALLIALAVFSLALTMRLRTGDQQASAGAGETGVLGAPTLPWISAVDARRPFLILSDGVTPLDAPVMDRVANAAASVGPVVRKSIAGYRRGDLAAARGAVYVGKVAAPVSAEFLGDLSDSRRPVVWLGANAEQLFDGVAPTQTPQGWYLGAPVVSDAVVRGQGSLARPASWGASRPAIVANPKSVLALAHTAKGDVAWAVRTRRLTYIADVPSDDPPSVDASLAIADLLGDALRSDFGVAADKPSADALVVVDAITPLTPPAMIADAVQRLAPLREPFVLAIDPVVIDASGQRIELRDRPDLVDALTKAQDLGAEFVLQASRRGVADSSADGLRRSVADRLAAFGRAHLAVPAVATLSEPADSVLGQALQSQVAAIIDGSPDVAMNDIYQGSSGTVIVPLTLGRAAKSADVVSTLDHAALRRQVRDRDTAVVIVPVDATGSVIGAIGLGLHRLGYGFVSPAAL